MKNEAKRILEFLAFSEKLKNQLRDNKLSGGRMESVADHSWQVALAIMMVAPHLKHKVDLLKCLKMAVVHDLAEAELGDIPYSESFNNPEIKKQKKLKEKQEILKIKKMIGGEVGDEIYDLWLEMEEKKTHEAKLVKAIDCLEANYQGILFGDIDWWDDIYYDLVLTKSESKCLHEEILGELNTEINLQVEEKMRRIGLDVEKIKSKSK